MSDTTDTGKIWDMLRSYAAAKMDEASQLEALRLQERATEIWLAHNDRLQQQRVRPPLGIGPSGVGTECDRRLAYALTDVPAVNDTQDPLKANIGTAFHSFLEDGVAGVDPRSRRYLREQSVEYRGCKGTADLYDRREKIVTDWKTSQLAKVKQIAKQGPTQQQISQVMIYAAGLIAQGEPVEYVSLVFIPTNGTMLDIHTWVAPFDRSVADAAIDRAQAIKDDALFNGVETVERYPSRLCGWCPYFNPESKDPKTSCVGQAKEWDQG